MSISLLADGQYKFFSTQFTSQGVVLHDGQPTGWIEGHRDNGVSGMVWNLTNVGNQVDQVTLRNAAPTAECAYAGIDETGTRLQGSPDPVTWTLLPTGGDDEYWIMAPLTDSTTTSYGQVWYLADGVDDTIITLVPFFIDDDPDTLSRRDTARAFKAGPLNPPPPSN